MLDTALEQLKFIRIIQIICIILIGAIIIKIKIEVWKVKKNELKS